MAEEKTGGKLEKLLQKKKQLEAQIAVVKQREKAEERKKDTRRKILVGSVLMRMVEQGELEHDKLQKMLDRHLSRAQDRALFGLPPRAQDR